MQVESGFLMMSVGLAFGVVWSAAGKQGNIQAHHLIEKRFARHFPASGVRDWLSVVVTRAEHQTFTNAWRQTIGYGAGAEAVSRAQVLDAARKAYADYPTILRALKLIE